MIPLYRVYSKYKLTLTDIATVIFHGYESGEKQLILQLHTTWLLRTTIFNFTL